MQFPHNGLEEISYGLLILRDGMTYGYADIALQETAQ